MVERVQGEVVATAGKNVKDETLMPVVAKSANVKKASGLKRLWQGFFAEDFKTVRTNVMDSVIKPSIKSGILNAITSAATMLLFGKNGYTPRPGGWLGPNYLTGGTAYSNITRVQNGQIVTNPGTPKVSIGTANFGAYTAAEVYNSEYIHYGSYQDAMNVYEALCERIAKYNVATVKNLYDLSGISNYEMVLQNWGWYGFDFYRVIPAGDGTWFLKLPQPTSLNSQVKTY